jgi:hypothetical protein
MHGCTSTTPIPTRKDPGRIDPDQGDRARIGEHVG